MFFVENYVVYSEKHYGVEAMQRTLDESGCDCYGIRYINEGAVLHLYPALTEEIPVGALDSYVDAIEASALIKMHCE